MWTIGIAGAWYEGIHHRSLEKAHAAAAEVKRVELKEKHTFGESPLAPTTTSLEFFSSLPLTFRARSRPLAAMKALEDHDQQLVEAEEFIRISKAAIEGAKHHIVDLQKKKKELEKAAEDSKNAYENYKPAPFGH